MGLAICNGATLGRKQSHTWFLERDELWVVSLSGAPVRLPPVIIFSHLPASSWIIRVVFFWWKLNPFGPWCTSGRSIHSVWIHLNVVLTRLAEKEQNAPSFTRYQKHWPDTLGRISRIIKNFGRNLRERESHFIGIQGKKRSSTALTFGTLNVERFSGLVQSVD